MVKKLDRRTLLRGAGGVALGLPFLQAMGCTIGGRPTREQGGAAGAAPAGGLPPTVAATGFPQRFIAFYAANGVVRDRWLPSGGTTDFTIPATSGLYPLRAHRDRLAICDGVDLAAARIDQPGDEHQRGMGTMLTAAKNVQNGGVWGGGISIDQVIADKIGGGTKFKSLELGVRTATYGDVWTRMCYRGAAQAMPQERNPAKVFTRVFSDLATGDDGGAAAALDARRRSVLGATLEDYHALEARLGSEDRARLAAHIQSISELEARLGSGGAVGGACQKPAAPSVDLEDTRTLSRSQIDLLVMALACDQTRVGSLQYGSSVNYTTFEFLDWPDKQHHHFTVHRPRSATIVEQITASTTWHMEQLAYLLDRLAAIPEGGGTLLDNTCVLLCSDMGEGQFHGPEDVPFVLAGGAGGAIQTGRFHQFGGKAHSGLLVALAQAYGVDIERFGEPDTAIAALPGILT